MEQITGIGLPFPPDYSSCSNLPPKLFKWTSGPSTIKIYIDGAIDQGLFDRATPTKFGWLCESRDICDDQYRKIKSNIEHYKKYFSGIFTCDETLLSDPFFIYAPPGSNLPWTKLDEMKVYQKTKSCSMICSPKSRTKGHQFRLEIADQLKDKIDLFGGAHGSQRIGQGIGPSGDWWRSKLPAIQDYRFSITFENAVYDKYYTEKITDCFATGTIPIYWGTKKVSEDFNPNGIIFWEDFKGIDSLTPELYESMMPYILENLERVKVLESADDILYKTIKSR